jgi:hypothetical protein
MSSLELPSSLRLFTSYTLHTKRPLAYLQLSCSVSVCSRTCRPTSSPSIHPLARRRESLGGNRDGRHCGKGMWARVSLFSVRARALSLCGTRCSSAISPWICYHVHVRFEATLSGSGAPPPCRVLHLPVTVSPRDLATYSLLCRADQPTTTTTTNHRATCCASPTTHSMVPLMPLI